MGDIVVKVLTPADDTALIALEDAKIMLGISASDTADDQQLQMLIEQNSQTVARLCNRVFAKERVRETHNAAAIQLLPTKSRIFLTHYPVKEEDIESVEANGVTLSLIDYVLEEESGKLSIIGGFATEIIVTYTGGYDLPDEAPLPLQHALVTLVRSTRAEAAQAAVSGIRMLSHKSARVMFHPPGGTSSTRTSGAVGGGSAVQQAINNLLMHYTRIEA